jgi:hypothetical protein
MENKEILEGVENTVKNVAENVAQQVENKPGFFKRNRGKIVAAVVGTAVGVLIGSKTAREKIVALGNDGLNACKNAFAKKDAPVLEEAPVEVAEETQTATAQSEEQAKPNHNKWEGKYKGGWNNNRPKYNNTNNFN